MVMMKKEKKENKKKWEVGLSYPSLVLVSWSLID